MPKKILVFLTKQYPFGFGERYVISELNYLSKAYERIFLYPSDYFGETAGPQLEVPDNVEVICLNLKLPTQVSKQKIIFSFLRAAFFEFFKTHNRRWFLKSFRQSFSIYSTQYVEGIALQNLLIERNVKLDEATFYSYWFSNSALCLSIMKERGAISHYYSKAHSVDLYHEKWGLLSKATGVPFFKNYKLKFVDLIFPISKHGQKFLEQSSKETRTRVAYLGVDDYGLNPEAVGEEEFVVVTCSNLSYNKRVHYLGKALSELNRKVKFIHFGSGGMEQELFDSIQSDKVKFDFRGRTPNEEVRKFYSENHIDLFVNLSIVEGLPVSIMEAFSHGIPVLATSVYGTPEAVIDGVSGRLIPGDFEIGELENSLASLMDSPEELKKMRKGARKVYEEKFQAQKNHTEFAEYLSSLP